MNLSLSLLVSILLLLATTGTLPLVALRSLESVSAAIFINLLHYSFRSVYLCLQYVICVAMVVCGKVFGGVWLDELDEKDGDFLISRYGTTNDKENNYADY